MRNAVRLPESDRRELFRNTAAKMGFNAAIAEKDFGYALRLPTCSADALGKMLFPSKMEPVFQKHSTQAELSQELDCKANICIDEKDRKTVIFGYPHLFMNSVALQVLCLEIGALAAWRPVKIAQIKPYA